MKLNYAMYIFRHPPTRQNSSPILNNNKNNNEKGITRDSYFVPVCMLCFLFLHITWPLFCFVLSTR